MMHGCAAAVPRSNVKFLGPINPTKAAPRQAKLEAARPIVVGDNVWLGGGRRPAVLRHPDVFHAAVAGDPVIDCYNSAAKGDPQPDQGRGARLGQGGLAARRG
jgi:hypothetical protein